MRACVSYALFVVLATVAARERGCRRPVPRMNLNVRNDNVIDLTYVFDENSAVWPLYGFGFEMVQAFKEFVDVGRGYYYAANTYRQPEHTGTHMDAPSHFSEGAADVSEVSLNNLIGPGVLINLVNNGERFGKDELITIEHFKAWEREHKRAIRTGSIVLLYTGYGEVYGDRTEYFGTSLTGPESIPYFHFPGLDPAAARWLVDKRCIAAIGIDTSSIDRGQSIDFQSHTILASANVSIFENVANLDVLAEKEKNGFKVFALPQKIGKGTGAPTRIMTILN